MYVETGGVKLLFDAGISGVRAKERLASHGRDIHEVDALIISHDHGDHVSHAGVFQRRFDVPIYITEKTLRASQRKYDLGTLHDVHHFVSGETIEFGDVTVQTVPSPHDSADGSVFVIVSKEKRLGIMTDIGYPFKELCAIVPSLDGIFLESNYDPEMLKNGPYPGYLIRRISGPEGHLSNHEAAELLLTGKRLKWACLSHLSNNCNDPETAIRTHRKVLGDDFSLHTASRYEPSDILRL